MNISELNNAIKNNKISPDVFLNELWKLSNGLNREARKFYPEKLNIYRTRVFQEKILPKSIKDLSYPPLEKSILQRASGVGNQVFYASAGLPTTLAESRVKSGEYIIVSKWRNSGDLIFQNVGFTENKNGIENLYSEIFTHRNESMYVYSSKVADHLMGADFISGLIYPSIINNNKSENLAIKKDHVDKNLKFINATLYFVKSISDDSKYEVEALDFALPTDKGLLDWKGRTKKWDGLPGCELKMISNGWDWEAFMPDGTYVDPQ